MNHKIVIFAGNIQQDLTASRLRRRVLLHCSDPEGDCPFTPRRSPNEGLPVLTVDEEIYRLTLDLVIATVDKLAQLPWRAATADAETSCTGTLTRRPSGRGGRTRNAAASTGSGHPR